MKWAVSSKVYLKQGYPKRKKRRHCTEMMKGENKNQELLTFPYKTKAVPLHAMEVLGWSGIAPTHSVPRQ
jgi:hypothetical protein